MTRLCADVTEWLRVLRFLMFLALGTGSWFLVQQIENVYVPNYHCKDIQDICFKDEVLTSKTCYLYRYPFEDSTGGQTIWTGSNINCDFPKLCGWVLFVWSASRALLEVEVYVCVKILKRSWAFWPMLLHFFIVMDVMAVLALFVAAGTVSSGLRASCQSGGVDDYEDVDRGDGGGGCGSGCDVGWHDDHAPALDDVGRRAGSYRYADLDDNAKVAYERRYIKDCLFVKAAIASTWLLWLTFIGWMLTLALDVHLMRIDDTLTNKETKILYRLHTKRRNRSRCRTTCKIRRLCCRCCCLKDKSEDDERKFTESTIKDKKSSDERKKTLEVSFENLEQAVFENPEAWPLIRAKN